MAKNVTASARKYLLDAFLIVALVSAAGVISYLNGRVKNLQALLETSGGDIMPGSRLLPLTAHVGTGTTTIKPGHPRIVFYVSPGCGSCARHMPSFRSIVARIGAANAIILGPGSEDQSVRELELFVRRQKIDNVLVGGISRNAMDELRLFHLPRVLLVDRGGRISAVFWDRPGDADQIVTAFRSL